MRSTYVLAVALAMWRLNADSARKWQKESRLIASGKFWAG
jgi:hypothetical protein